MNTLKPSVAGWLLLLFGTVSLHAAERDDRLVADFEGDDYGAWKVTGTAFGSGPARGALPNQMPVSGYEGRGLVNSYSGGDDSTGTLTSPPFPIERRWINFLIGGGKHPGETCMNLRIDGQVVRAATGPNGQPGGSEKLSWQSWDVSGLAGKTAIIEIVDQRGGGWGHITIDQIVQSDRDRGERPADRELVIAARYLNLPVKTGAVKRRMRFVLAEKTVREFEIELADAAPDFWAFSDVSAFQGKSLTIAVDALPRDSRGLTAIVQDDTIKGDEGYAETHRPQFHFTSRRGWLNDPNGLVYFQGEYHLFYQHNPYGWDWGNMHWGHAVSPDLVHWKELPIALSPLRFGDWAFSGSAVVDAANTGGFQEGREPALVAAYTSTGRGECIAFSRDRGRTWDEYAGNPVVKHQGRDPKVLWHAPTKQWVMAVYDEFEQKRWVAFHTSADLKNWRFQSRIEGFFECPDLLELPVDQDPSRTRWVLYAADGEYMTGAFDGTAFHPEAGKQRLWHGNFYAAQTYSNAPDGRHVQIGWGSGITFPGMPFNQQMTFPCALTLRATPEGVRLFAEPVAELASLRGPRHEWTDLTIKAGDNPLDGPRGDLFEITAEFAVGSAASFGFTIRGVPVVYDMAKRELTCHGKTAPLSPADGQVRLRVLVDRGSIEVFGNDGRVALSVGVIPSDDDHALGLFARGGNLKVRSLTVFALKSAWPHP